MFKKKPDHVGSGIDKPNPKSLVEKVLDKVKPAPAPIPPKTP
jgi:hypothetical protein